MRIETLQNIAISRDGKCLTNVYISMKTYYEWSCNKCVNIWKARADHVVRGSWCSVCFYKQHSINKTRKNGLEYLRNLAVQNNGKCLSLVYIRSDTKYDWQCNECAYIWKASASTINAGHWCGKCCESKGEKAINQFLQFNGLVLDETYFREFKFDDCKYIRKLLFDFWIPSLKLAIEYDGAQHFRQSTGFWRNCKLEDIKLRDEIKTKYCENNDIRLLRIPYKQFRNINEILCKEVNI